MDDQIEESEALGGDNWNADYDIAEDEEERLLEEDEILERKHLYQYESDQNYVTTEFETTEVEEDILDLGLNEDIVEFEETNADPQAASSENIVMANNVPVINGTEESQKKFTKIQFDGADSVKPEMRRNADQKRTVQPVMPRKNFNRQPNFGAQMRNVPYRIENSNQHLRRHPFDMPHQRSLLGRVPSLMDHNAHPVYDRVCLPNGDNFPVSNQPFMHGPMSNEQHFGSHQYLIEQERINGGNRCFINPHYKGSVATAGPAPNRMTPTTELGPCFVNPVKALPLRSVFQGVPSQRPLILPNAINQMNQRPRNMPPLPPPNMRFPPPTVLPGLSGPPPRLNIAHNSKPTPARLMDMILPTPFPETPARLPFLQEPPPRLPRFRFNSQEPPPSIAYDSSTSNPRFMGPPPIVKRLPPTEKMAAVPFKQSRTVTSCNISTGYRAFPPPVRNPTPHSASPNLRVVSTQKPPIPPSTNIPTPTSKNTLVVTPVQSKTEAPPPDEELSPEMKEYLAKVEEQAKKRSEVIRMKEERRRLKLAASSDAPSLTGGNAPNSAGPVNKVNLETGGPQSVVTNSVNPNNFAQNNLGPNQGPASSNQLQPAAPQTTRKTLLVKPTPTVSNVAPSLPSGRQFRTIIVKDKSGNIVERRRVAMDGTSTGTPTGSDRNRGYPAAINNTNLTNLTPVHVSKTVTIENLNPNSTEDDVRNLCQMFGSVQEVFPKLQEGKAVVRFKTVSGANNFLCNHNTPGISVTSE